MLAELEVLAQAIGDVAAQAAGRQAPESGHTRTAHEITQRMAVHATPVYYNPVDAGRQQPSTRYSPSPCALFSISHAAAPSHAAARIALGIP